MGKVITLVSKKEAQEREAARQLVDFSNEIDKLVFDYLQQGSDPREVAGILAHRLGTFMGGMSNKAQLWSFCEQVVKRQAELEAVE